MSFRLCVHFVQRMHENVFRKRDCIQRVFVFEVVNLSLLYAVSFVL